MNTNHYQNLARTRLALQVSGATVSTEDCRAAAQKLEARLEPPTILHEITPADVGQLPSLLQPATAPFFQTIPTALFIHADKLKGGYLPSDWVHTYLLWTMRLQRWKEFETCRQLFEKDPHVDKLPVYDGVVAGLLLFLLSPEPNSSLRQQLFTLALTHPTGAYLVAEGHHTSEERRAIVDALQTDSQLLYRLSHQPAFRELALLKLKGRFSFWAGLALAGPETSEEVLSAWLQRVAVTACDEPVAAVTALALQPDAPSSQKHLWLACLQSPAAGRQAYEAVWRTRHTWPVDQWVDLKSTLRASAISDRAAGFCNWMKLDPEWTLAEFSKAPVDVLWSLEIVYERYLARLPLDDRQLRNQLVEKLIANHGDHLATYALNFLNQLQDGALV